jgi:hypothetical protein
MAQIIYGSDPDALERQQNFYDQFNFGAAESNRNALQNANAQTVDLIMRQRAADENARRYDIGNTIAQNQFQQSRNDAANENAANRATELKLYGSKGDTSRFNELVKNLDWLPSDPNQLAKFTAGITPEQFNQLRAMIGQRDQVISANTLDQFQRTATPDSVIPPGLTPEHQAVAKQYLDGLRKPYNDQFADASKQAALSNFAVKNPPQPAPANNTPIIPPTILGKIGAVINPLTIPMTALGKWTAPSPDTTLSDAAQARLRSYASPDTTSKNAVLVKNPDGTFSPIVQRPPWLQSSPVLQPTSAPATSAAIAAAQNQLPDFGNPVASSPVTSSRPVDVLRAQALQAIRDGKDPVSVRARFKQLSGGSDL